MNKTKDNLERTYRRYSRVEHLISRTVCLVKPSLYFLVPQFHH